MATESAPVVVPQSLKASARRFYLENAAMNALKKSSEGERKSLFTAMEEAGIERFSFETTNDEGDKLRLEVEVDTPEKAVIPVEVLRPLVDDETFLRIVKATKKDVEEHAGKAIAVKATKTVLGTRNVFVKPAA